MKEKTGFVCTACGGEAPRWLGRCPSCGEWNSFAPLTAGRRGGKPAAAAAPSIGGALALEKIDAGGGDRFGTGIEEFDRVLGGGIVRGSCILVGGEPGIGKSTLLLQCAAAVGAARQVLYVTGEESPGQIRSRADRLGLTWKKVAVLADTDLERIEKTLAELKPELVVVDSIQTLYSRELGPTPGSVNQVRLCSWNLADWARGHQAAVMLIAHVTKEGLIAGPRLIEHLVDTVLYFEHSGADLRFLRAAKNRFGSVDEIGLFYMRERGLVQVQNPASLFLVERSGPLPPGVAAAPVYEGSRVLLVEIQALTVPGKSGLSRVYSDRIDSGRVSRLAAVIEKQTSVRFSDQDVYVNVAGGIRLSEVGIDLPLAVALYSARTGLAVPEHLTICGEVSLAGEIRPVAHFRRRLRAAADLGFSRCVGPARLRDDEENADDWTRVSTITECIGAIFGLRSAGEKRPRS